MGFALSFFYELLAITIWFLFETYLKSILAHPCI